MQENLITELEPGMKRPMFPAGVWLTKFSENKLSYLNDSLT